MRRPADLPHRRSSTGFSRRQLFSFAVGGGIVVAAAAGVARAALVSGGPTRHIGGIPAPGPGTPPMQPALALSIEQRVGQLFMVGLPSGASDAGAALTNDAITSSHAGSVVLFGSHWNSADSIRVVVGPLQKLARAANGGVGLFVSGNQEGGQAGSFQAFYGDGFSVIPSPIMQAQGDPVLLQAQAQRWGAELLKAGVNLDLAPVLDTVPAGTADSNDPIGHWGREYGFTPGDVQRYGVAFERGMRAAGIAVAIKHFPGLGRVTGNTDFTAEGIVDNTFTGADDPYIQPYKAGIDAGAEFVMMSLASYPRVDPQPAVFSSTMIGGILRGSLGFQKIVISDDVGAAVAVADRPPARRALDFLRAGGDMVLTVQPTDIAPMTRAVLEAVAADAAFAAQIDASVERVLNVKAAYGLLPPA
jgi:beta-N-acetylhexosaminidase